MRSFARFIAAAAFAQTAAAVSPWAARHFFETRKPEFRIGHLRLASNRNVALRSAGMPQ